MLDKDIRQAVRARLGRLLAGDLDARIVEELDLGPTARADLVVLNGRIEGYEIKSDHDSLLRLSHQVDAYEAVCDRVWLVTTDRFAEQAGARLPAWWGILVARYRRGEVVLARRRVAKPHRQQRVRALVELLWRRELLAMCGHHSLAHARSRSRVAAIGFKGAREACSLRFLSIPDRRRTGPSPGKQAQHDSRSQPDSDGDKHPAHACSL